MARLAACALVIGLLGTSGAAIAGKKDDTLRFAYDQAAEGVDRVINGAAAPTAGVSAGSSWLPV